MSVFECHRGLGRHTRVTDEMSAAELAESVAISNFRRQPNVLVEIDVASHAEHAYGGVFPRQPFAHRGRVYGRRDDAMVRFDFELGIAEDPRLDLPPFEPGLRTIHTQFAILGRHR